MSSKYAKLTAKGSKGRKGHQAKADANEAKSAKLQKKLVEPQLLDPARYKVQRDQGQFYPQAANGLGDWYRTGKEDDEMQILQEIQSGENGTPGKSKYGQIMAPTEKLISYYQGKKAQEGNVRLHRLGAFMIDPKNPATQERAYEIMPDLKKYPEEYHLRNIEIQETIRTWLRDGQISGMDDLILLDHIIRDDFVIEYGPLWDPKGLIQAEVAADVGFLDMLPAAIQRGLWNPRRHGQDDAVRELRWQRNLKAKLLKRVLAGFRDWDLANIVDWMVVHRTSQVTGADTDNSYVNWFENDVKNRAYANGYPQNWNPEPRVAV
jgi:hypothetical protein